jgi:hypothetical protein
MTKRERYISTRNRLAVSALFLLCFLGAKGLRFRSSLCSLKLVALMGLILMAGNAWGQTEITGGATIEDGYYYIIGTKRINDNTYETDPLNYYYLCPTENYQYYQDTDPYHTTSPNGKPFMTTYQCRNTSTYAEEKSIWYIKKYTISNKTYYSIKHVKENKYFTFNRQTLSENKGRLRVHLEASPSVDNDTLFQIVFVSSADQNQNIKPCFDAYDIIAKGAENSYNDHSYKYLNVNKGNQLSLQGTNIETNNDIFTGGIIGAYKSGAQSDVNARWNFMALDYLEAPTITPTSTEHSYIINPAGTLPTTGFSIRYTLDANVIPDVSTGNAYELGDEIAVQQNECLRAWVAGTIGSLGLMSPVVEVCEGAPAPTFEVLCQDELQIIGAEGTQIYYTINDATENPSSTHGTLYDDPIEDLSDEDVVRAVAYLNGTASDMAQFTYHPNTEEPSVALTSTTATITAQSVTGETTTIYYTLDGTTPATDGSGTTISTTTNPVTVTIDPSENLTLKVIAQVSDRGASCPVTKVMRPKWPTLHADHLCYGSEPVNMLTIDTEDNRTYYYALSNGSGQAAPDPDTYTYIAYTPGEEVNIQEISNWDGSLNVTLHAYSKDIDNNRSLVNSVSLNMDYTDAPTITHSGNTVTIAPPSTASTATIHYTVDGGDVQTYLEPFTVTNGYSHTIIATARYGSEGESCEAIHRVRLPITITSLDQINDMNGAYDLDSDVDATGFTTFTNDFKGWLNGNYHTISNLSVPLFNVIDGGTVNNLKLANVNITTGTNIGAICNEATGATKIYNCGVLSGSVSGSDNVGGLVGLINSGSSVRVVNCYNYANVSGGSYAAGIVGKNDGTVGAVRIALCMMYGNVTTATNRSPVYCGNHVSNSKNFTEYNYWRYRSRMQYTAYNDQMAIDKDDYLSRFPFYRHILNTHRELAAYFLFAANTTQGSVVGISQDDIDEIGHWALKKDIAPYPIIERWQTNTKKVLDAPTPSNILTEMGGTDHPGYLYITVKIGSNTYTERAPGQPYKLPITDMDEANYDYTWGKVVLPFANEFEINSDYSKICTGWKITDITGGTAGTFEHYNVSDRNCTAKDLYSTTGFIFAQGGNFIVPYGVTAIEITANFANAFYLCDESYEIAYEKDGETVPPNTTGSAPSGYMTRTTLAGSTPNTYHGQDVHHTLAAALGAMINSGTTHAQAIVLVGNYHLDDFDLATLGLLKKGYTFMSIDADNNQEPDYAIYSNNTMDRPAIPPTRYDFVAFIPIGMSSHVNGAFFYPNTPIWKPRGWFEITETGLMWANQFEIDSGNFNSSDGDTRNYRCIINGGYFTQMVRSRKGACTKLKYYQIGGKAYVKEFYPGNHSQNNFANTIVPVNVTGGEIEQCFMTGYGKGTVYGPCIYFWCAGGKIGKFLGSYMETPRQTSDSDGNVDLTAKIDHAIIGRFFGGGTTEKAKITGNIDVTINNSKVDFYCGGPEFGNMVGGKTVTTHAFNTTFGEYYGAGFGGTAITYRNDKDDSSVALAATVNYPDHFTTCYVDNTNHHGRLYYLADYGIGSCYKFEFIMHSRGHKGVARFYTGFASFSLATTGNVVNDLDNCTILNSFYGAGCQGMVNGTVTSTLTDCTVLGSAFGGGYKAAANEVDVYPTAKPLPYSTFTAETGIFSDFGTQEPDTYHWEQGNQTTQNTVSGTTLYTSKDITLTDLGNVTGDIKITLNGNTTVRGSVFGGGNESKSLSNTLVEILEHTKVLGNIYGGGNMAEVEGNTKVIVNGRSSGSNTSTDPSSGPTGD